MESPPSYSPPPYSPKGKKSSTGLIIGLVVIGVGLCCVLPVALIGGGAWFGFTKAKGSFICFASFGEVSEALHDYAKANGGKMPTADKWQDQLRPYYEKAVARSGKDRGPFTPMPASGDWGCTMDDGTRTGMAFNTAISGKLEKDIPDPDKTVAIFEIEAPRKNAAEPYKARDDKKGPVFIMGQRRGWISISASGELLVNGPDGKPMQGVNIRTKGSDVDVNIRTTSGSDGQ